MSVSSAIRRLFRDRAPASPVAPPAPQSPAERRVRDLVAQGKPVDAMRVARENLAAAPQEPGLSALYAWTLEHVGRHEEALGAYLAELAANPGHPEAQARASALRAALAPPQTSPGPGEPRSWHTSIPRPTLLVLQRAHHQYTYRGVLLLKNPFDLALYQRLLWALKPRTILEIGSKSGGSALWLGDLLNSFGIDGRVYSLDIVRVDQLSHPRVTFLEGDGRNLAGGLSREFLASLPRPWLVIEDADHAYETSIAVLNFFHPLLRPGEFIVVEDGIISDLNEDPGANSGPHRALKEFLGAHPAAYVIDPEYCDFFGYNVTWCTNGWLRRTDESAASRNSMSGAGSSSSGNAPG